MASSRSSGLKTADAVIATGRNRINAITLIGGSTASAVVVYDHPSAASGTVLAKATQATNLVTTHIVFENPVLAEDGIFADISGTDAAYIIYFGG